MKFSNAPVRRNFRKRFQTPKGVTRNNVIRRGRRSGGGSNSNGSTFYRFYVNSLTAAGLIVPIGPDAQYKTSSYYMASRSFNNYKVTSVSLEYTPLVNQTNAVSMVNAYLTTDLKAVIPADDQAMKNNTVTHFGGEWFAANRIVKRFKLPVLKQNTYETGSGEGDDAGSGFENCANVIIKPTSLTDAKLAVGEIYLKVGVKFTGPAAPHLTAGAINQNGLKPDTDYTVGQALTTTALYHVIVGGGLIDSTQFLIHNGKESYNITWSSTSKNRTWSDIYTLTELIGVKDGDIVSFTAKSSGDVYAPKWSETSGEWVKQSSTLFNVQLTNHVVPAVSEQVWGQFQNFLKASTIPMVVMNESVPVHNKITEDTDVTTVDITNTSVPTHNKITEDTDDTNVVITQQPIKVEQEKDSASEILGILEEVALLAVKE